jgi:hypothetical protein
MQTHTEDQTFYGHKPIPNPRGTQTVPQPEPTVPRSPDGRFTPEFDPNPPQVDQQR